MHTIASDELAGRALTPAQRRWLGMVAELNVNRAVDMTGHPPMYTGWYFDLFLNRQEDGMRGADYIADYFTSQEVIAYVGATAPRMGVFVVDTGGAPRAFVGPVARAYEVHGPLGARYTDESAKTLTRRDAPWAASYTVAAPPTPSSLQLRYDAETRQLVLTSDRAARCGDDQGARSSSRRGRDRAHERQEGRDAGCDQEQAHRRHFHPGR